MGILHAEVAIEDPLIHSHVPVKKERKRIRATSYVIAARCFSTSGSESMVESLRPRSFVLPTGGGAMEVEEHDT